MRSKKLLSAAMCLCMTIPMLAVQSPASVSADVALMGDANGDGRFNIADAVMTQKWLVGSGYIDNWENVDFCKDGVIDSFDLALLCKELVRQTGIELPPDFLAQCLSKDIRSNEVDGAIADEEFIMSQTSFALELMKREVKDGENTLISPYSIIQALAMTANGAGEETRAEMEKAMGGLPVDKLNEYLYSLIKSCSKDPGCVLKTANSIWIKESDDFEIDPDFLQTNADYYKADIYEAPFDDSTIKDINDWVNVKTDKMIPGIIEEIDPNEFMYLVNAVTFDADWSAPYTDDSITESYFTRGDGAVQAVSMMSEDSYGKYLKGENAEGFLKNYRGGRYAFAAILPDEGITPAEYINTLTAEELNRMLSNPEKICINTTIPKFSYDYDTDLIPTLIDMGMKSAFESSMDNFRNMFLKVFQPQYISGVDHKTHIEVNQKGTRAAGATIVKVAFESAGPFPEKDIILNRPFVYAIVDKENNIPVFIGTVESVDPVDDVEKDSDK